MRRIARVTRGGCIFPLARASVWGGYSSHQQNSPGWMGLPDRLCSRSRRQISPSPLWQQPQTRGQVFRRASAPVSQRTTSLPLSAASQRSSLPIHYFADAELISFGMDGTFARRSPLKGGQRLGTAPYVTSCTGSTLRRRQPLSAPGQSSVFNPVRTAARLRSARNAGEVTVSCSTLASALEDFFPFSGTYRRWWEESGQRWTSTGRRHGESFVDPIAPRLSVPSFTTSHGTPSGNASAVEFEDGSGYDWRCIFLVRLEEKTSEGSGSLLQEALLTAQGTTDGCTTSHRPPPPPPPSQEAMAFQLWHAIARGPPGSKLLGCPPLPCAAVVDDDDKVTIAASMASKPTSESSIELPFTCTAQSPHTETTTLAAPTAVITAPPLSLAATLPHDLFSWSRPATYELYHLDLSKGEAAPARSTCTPSSSGESCGNAVREKGWWLSEAKRQLRRVGRLHAIPALPQCAPLRLAKTCVPAAEGMAQGSLGTRAGVPCGGCEMSPRETVGIGVAEAEEERWLDVFADPDALAMEAAEVLTGSVCSLHDYIRYLSGDGGAAAAEGNAECSHDPAPSPSDSSAASLRTVSADSISEGSPSIGDGPCDNDPFRKKSLTPSIAHATTTIAPHHSTQPFPANVVPAPQNESRSASAPLPLFCFPPPMSFSADDTCRGYVPLRSQEHWATSANSDEVGSERWQPRPSKQGAASLIRDATKRRDAGRAPHRREGAEALPGKTAVSTGASSTTQFETGTVRGSTAALTVVEGSETILQRPPSCTAVPHPRLLSEGGGPTYWSRMSAAAFVTEFSKHHRLPLLRAGVQRSLSPSSSPSCLPKKTVGMIDRVGTAGFRADHEAGEYGNGAGYSLLRRSAATEEELARLLAKYSVGVLLVAEDRWVYFSVLSHCHGEMPAPARSCLHETKKDRRHRHSCDLSHCYCFLQPPCSLRTEELKKWADAMAAERRAHNSTPPLCGRETAAGIAVTEGKQRGPPSSLLAAAATASCHDVSTSAAVAAAVVASSQWRMHCPTPAAGALPRTWLVHVSSELVWQRTLLSLWERVFGGGQEERLTGVCSERVGSDAEEESDLSRYDEDEVKMEEQNAFAQDRDVRGFSSSQVAASAAAQRRRYAGEAELLCRYLRIAPPLPWCSSSERTHLRSRSDTRLKAGTPATWGGPMGAGPRRHTLHAHQRSRSSSQYMKAGALPVATPLTSSTRTPVHAHVGTHRQTLQTPLPEIFMTSPMPRASDLLRQRNWLSKPFVLAEEMKYGLLVKYGRAILVVPSQL